MKIKDVLHLPTIEIGDEILVGKFKNRRATVTGFDVDEHNQPVLKTTKGDQKLFKPRIVKLNPPDEE
jgi:signal peptidase I